jgi:Mrp family chromosome partitioning ATPase/capsular polysaccharide biosynthesis protein
VNPNDLLRLLRRFRLVAVVVALIVMAAGTAVALRSPNRYQSSATVIVDPTIVSGQAANVQQIDFLIPQYLALLKSRSYLIAARSTLPASIRDAPISVAATGEPGTGIIDITVTSTVRTAVAPWAGALAQRLVTQAKEQLAVLKLIDVPQTPSKPYAPNRLFVIALSALIALFTAIISVIVAGALRARRDGAAEIRERFGIRVLAEIPTLPRRLAILTPPQLATSTAAVPVVDALQTLRASVSYLLADRAHPWLAVVSARGREGKSFVAVQLSWLLGALEHETLLLDADARNPTAHQLLELSAAPGIEALDATNLGDVMQRTGRERLGFIGAGQPDRHPAEVASAHLPFLLKQIDGHNVTLVVDTPPMAGAAETVIYAAGCGAVLLVIDARRRDFSDVEQMLLTLNDRRIDVLGVVINRSRRGNMGKRMAWLQLGRRANSPAPPVSPHSNGPRGSDGQGWEPDAPAGLVRTDT